LKAPRIPKALKNAIRSNDPESVCRTLPSSSKSHALFVALHEEADRVGIELVARCQREINEPAPDVWSSLDSLGIQISNYLNIKSQIYERQPYRVRTAEEILAVYSKKETWDEMLKDVEGDPEWHSFFKERIEKTFAGTDAVTEAETPDAIRTILRLDPAEPPADTKCGEV